MEENKEKVQEQLEDAPIDGGCNPDLKPPKPPGMGINAYCPCKDGQWGQWFDPEMA